MLWRRLLYLTKAQGGSKSPSFHGGLPSFVLNSIKCDSSASLYFKYERKNVFIRLPSTDSCLINNIYIILVVAAKKKANCFKATYMGLKIANKRQHITLFQDHKVLKQCPIEIEKNLTFFGKCRTRDHKV